MTTEEIQRVSLDILKEFHTFCIENDLKYSLEGGTLLGAIRHKGFIPWDNDVDVMMPRPDYNRFVSQYRDNDNYACFSDERKNCYIAYARLAEIKRTYVNPFILWSNRDTGVWIDVFPVDGVEDDKNEFNNTVRIIYKLWVKLCKSRGALSSFNSCDTLYQKLRLVMKKILYHKSAYYYLYQHLSICRRFEYDKSENVSIVAYNGDSKLYFPREIMNNYVKVPFENLLLNSIENYSSYLESEFGDYMKLPPVNQRFIHDMHRYYWKE